MKKLLFSLCISLVVMLISASTILAAVDLTLDDSSSTEQKKVTIQANSNSDSLSEISFNIQASSDVSVTDVTETTGVCDTFSYTNTDNKINIKCVFNDATSVNGAIADILFTSDSEDYTFGILEDEDMNVGTLEVGTITEVGEVVEDTTSTEEDTSTTEEDTTVTPTTTSTQNTVMKYLPYALIGGAAILLISIIAILVAKKGEKKDPEVEVESIPTTSPLDNPPTDMDNVSASLYTPQPVEQTLKDKVNGSNDLTEEIDEPKYTNETVNVSTTDQSRDLQDILGQTPNTTEALPVQEELVTPIVEPVVETPVGSPLMPNIDMTMPTMPETITEAIVEPPVETPTMPAFEMAMPTIQPQKEILTPNEEVATIPTEEVPDLQQFINNQVAQIPSTPEVPQEITPTTTETTPTTPGMI